MSGTQNRGFIVRVIVVLCIVFFVLPATLFATFYFGDTPNAWQPIAVFIGGIAIVFLVAGLVQRIIQKEASPGQVLETKPNLPIETTSPNNHRFKIIIYPLIGLEVIMLSVMVGVSVSASTSTWPIILSVVCTILFLVILYLLIARFITKRGPN
jgi:protein-S-isoprenylcysteine O-methyltransferase Ste14